MHRSVILVLVLLFPALIVNPRSALAGTITVNTTAQSPGVTGDCTLGEAIQAANTDTAVDGCLAGSGTDIITLPAGTYTLNQIDSNEPFIGALGLPIVYSDLTISGAGADTTIIQRDADAPAFRILFLAGDSIVVHGVTVRGGSTMGAFVSSAGIGIEQFSSVTLSNLIVSHNAGIGVTSLGDLVLQSSEIQDNEGRGLVGGTAHAHPVKTITVLDSNIHNNAEEGIYAVITDLSVQNSIVADNGGHGISSYIARLSIFQTTIANNNGSGIKHSAGQTYETPTALQIENSSIFDNLGPGVDVRGTNAAVAITNSTLARNKGALSLDKSTAQVSIVNSTLAFNRASSGGGILHADTKGSITLLNTILAQNKGKQGTDCSGKIKSLGHNIIGNLNGCTLKTKKSDQITNPRLGIWTDNNTPGNGHYPLLPASPAIDNASSSNCDPTDQLGNPRVGRCDIGAIEYTP